MIYLMDLHKLDPVISGGERSMVEFGKWLEANRLDWKLIVPEMAWDAYQGEDLGDKGKHHILPRNSRGAVGDIGGEPACVTYAERLADFANMLPYILVKEEDTIVCYNEIAINAIAFRMLAKKTRYTRVIYWWRKVVPQGKRGLYAFYWWLTRGLYPRTMVRYSTIVTHNKTYRKSLERYMLHQRIHILDNYSGARRPPDSGIEKIHDVLWFGRMQKHKGVMDVLKIHKAGLKRHRKINFAVVGDGDQYKKFGRHAHCYRHEVPFPGITVWGHLDDDDASYKMAQCRICIITSRMESYCNVIIEAMAMGLPVIAYHLDHYHELFGEGGIITVPMGDTEAMADAILNLLDADLYWQKCVQASEFAAGKTWEKHSEEMFDLCMKPQFGRDVSPSMGSELP